MRSNSLNQILDHKLISNAGTMAGVWRLSVNVLHFSSFFPPLEKAQQKPQEGLQVAATDVYL